MDCLSSLPSELINLIVSYLERVDHVLAFIQSCKRYYQWSHDSLTHLPSDRVLSIPLSWIISHRSLLTLSNLIVVRIDKDYKQISKLPRLKSINLHYPGEWLLPLNLLLFITPLMKNYRLLVSTIYFERQGDRLYYPKYFNETILAVFQRNTPQITEWIGYRYADNDPCNERDDLRSSDLPYVVFDDDELNIRPIDTLGALKKEIGPLFVNYKIVQRITTTIEGEITHEALKQCFDPGWDRWSSEFFSKDKIIPFLISVVEDGILIDIVEQQIVSQTAKAIKIRGLMPI